MSNCALFLQGSRDWPVGECEKNKQLRKDGIKWTGPSDGRSSASWNLSLFVYTVEQEGGVYCIPLNKESKYWMTKEIKRKEEDMITPSFCGRQTLIQKKEKAQMQ